MLFSLLPKPSRKAIQVGGGVIYSKSIGTATVKVDNRRIIDLTNILFVLDLRCTLLSVAKLYKSSLIRESDLIRYLFSRTTNRKLMFKAKATNGLFLLDKILDEANGIEFRDRMIARRRNLVEKL